MIQIPILLTNLNFDHPIVWNGQSLEMFNLSYKQIADRVGALRLNRADLYNRIARIKMDMGKIRRIDIFDLDGTENVSHNLLYFLDDHVQYQLHLWEYFL